MKSNYEKIQEKYEAENGTNYTKWGITIFEEYCEEIEATCNKDYDTFKKECQIMDAKNGGTKEAERMTAAYKEEVLDDLNAKYEDVFFALYNQRCYIKGVEWIETDEDGNEMKWNTAEYLTVELPIINRYDSNYKFFQIPDII